MNAERYEIPREIQDLHLRFAVLMHEASESIQGLTSAKGTADEQRAQTRLNEVFTELGSVTTRLADYHRKKAESWQKKKGELAEQADFYQRPRKK